MSRRSFSFEAGAVSKRVQTCCAAFRSRTANERLAFGSRDRRHQSDERPINSVGRLSVSISQRKWSLSLSLSLSLFTLAPSFMSPSFIPFFFIRWTPDKGPMRERTGSRDHRFGKGQSMVRGGWGGWFRGGLGGWEVT